MANYLTTDTELTSIANAIRTKGGTNAQLTFPTGFVTAINNISTGGGAAEVAATTYANNNGNKTSISLTVINGFPQYTDTTVDSPSQLYSFIIDNLSTLFGMIADSNGNVAWKGKVFNIAIFNGGDMNEYYFGGGDFHIDIAEQFINIPGEVDPETGEPEEDTQETDYSVYIAAYPVNRSTIYLSDTAF